MPKELVYGCQPPFGDDNAAQVVQVGWSRDETEDGGLPMGTGFIQLASRCLGRDGHEPYLTNEELLEEGRRAAANEPPVLPITSGFFVDLDWAGCNRLIRVLQRARDQAFGAPA